MWNHLFLSGYLFFDCSDLQWEYTAREIFHLLYYVGFVIYYVLKRVDINLLFSVEEENYLACRIRDLGKGFWGKPKVQWFDQKPGCVPLEFTEAYL